MSRVGLLGGTFDPIHTAHLRLAREAEQTYALDRVLFVPAANPPHKAASAGYEDRYRMVELACAGEPGFVASRLEEGPETSYSIHTIERLKASGDQVFFIIGADAFAEIRTWRRWRDVVDAVDFIVATRPGHAYASPEGARVHTLGTLTLPVASKEIRHQLAGGLRPAEIPPAVLDYIQQHRLYR